MESKTIAIVDVRRKTSREVLLSDYFLSPGHPEAVALGKLLRNREAFAHALLAADPDNSQLVNECKRLAAKCTKANVWKLVERVHHPSSTTLVTPEEFEMLQTFAKIVLFREPDGRQRFVVVFDEYDDRPMETFVCLAQIEKSSWVSSWTNEKRLVMAQLVHKGSKLNVKQQAQAFVGAGKRLIRSLDNHRSTKGKLFPHMPKTTDDYLAMRRIFWPLECKPKGTEEETKESKEKTKEEPKKDKLRQVLAYKRSYPRSNRTESSVLPTKWECGCYEILTQNWNERRLISKVHLCNDHLKQAQEMDFQDRKAFNDWVTSIVCARD